MCAGVTGLSLLVTPFLMQLSTRYLQLDGDPGVSTTHSRYSALALQQYFGVYSCCAVCGMKWLAASQDLMSCRTQEGNHCRRCIHKCIAAEVGSALEAESGR